MNGIGMCENLLVGDNSEEPKLFFFRQISSLPSLFFPVIHISVDARDFPLFTVLSLRNFLLGFMHG